MSEPIAVMRNRVTTEFRKVAPASEEYLELQAMRDPNDGLPVWEETSLPNAVEQSKRLNEGKPNPHDFGDSAGPTSVLRGAPEPFVPAGDINEPLPSEREAGAEQEVPANPMPIREEVTEPEVSTDVSGTQPELEDTETVTDEADSGGSKRKRRSKKAAAETEEAPASE